MTVHYAGGCAHVHVTATAEPIDNHECHCNVCKSVTGQQHTHVAFFNHADVQVDHSELTKRAPFNANNPNGPLEIVMCTECGAALMLDDKQGRIRVAVPNVMGYDDAKFPKATYHAFWDETKGYEKPQDGRPVFDGLRPEFVWPGSVTGAWFSSDDAAYLLWLAENPAGVVLNLRQKPSEEYAVLHKASCRTISRRNDRAGGYTERRYSKLCAASPAEAKSQFAKLLNREVVAFSNFCSLCKP